MAALRCDHSGLLKTPNRIGDAGPPHSKEFGDRIVRERQVIGAQTILGHEKPARETLLH